MNDALACAPRRRGPARRGPASRNVLVAEALEYLGHSPACPSPPSSTRRPPAGRLCASPPIVSPLRADDRAARLVQADLGLEGVNLRRGRTAGSNDEFERALWPASRSPSTRRTRPSTPARRRFSRRGRRGLGRSTPTTPAPRARRRSRGRSRPSRRRRRAPGGVGAAMSSRQRSTTTSVSGRGTSARASTSGRAAEAPLAKHVGEGSRRAVARPPGQPRCSTGGLRVRPNWSSERVHRAPARRASRRPPRRGDVGRAQLRRDLVNAWPTGLRRGGLERLAPVLSGESLAELVQDPWTGVEACIVSLMRWSVRGCLGSCTSDLLGPGA